MRTRGKGALHDLVDHYEECDACPLLCENRRNVVFGSGSASAKVLIIGEAPGKNEDDEGLPFVGDAGKLLMSLLARAWPRTSEIEDIQNLDDNDAYFEALRDYLDDHVFWMNLVCCRPPDNRNPTPAEIKNCADRMYRTIYAVDPTLIIATGKLPASKLLGKSVAITDKSGEIFDVEIPSPVTGKPVRYPMLALVHPSWLLRQGDMDLVKRKRGKTYAAIEALKHALSLLSKCSKQVHGTNFVE